MRPICITCGVVNMIVGFILFTLLLAIAKELGFGFGPSDFFRLVEAVAKALVKGLGLEWGGA